MTPEATLVPSGIAPFDDRVGGLERGGTYLVVGAPGPEKMVAALQFVHAGVDRGEASLLVTNSDVEGILSVADAWGFDLREAWLDGTLQVLGFKEDFELRAIRSIAPEEVIEELVMLATPDLDRVAVDPGAMFLSGGAKTLLGSAFLGWTRSQAATVLTTFSVDGGATSLPSSADWLIHATTGRLLLERRGDGLHQLTLSKAVPVRGQRDETFTLELEAGRGLIEPERLPSRRGADRGRIDEGRLLLVSLGDSHASDLEEWAERAFSTEVVAEPFEAVTRVQSEARYGAVLVHAPRARVRDAIQACRAMRPLTRAAIVFASDDAVRSTDRIQILEAGADDCLSGGLDFRELGLRIKQAVAAGARPVRPETTDETGTVEEEPSGGRVTRARFVEEVERRAADPDLAFFCVLDVRSDALEPAELEEALAHQVRGDEGDIVSRDGEGCAVLLQGAREAQLGGFLDRLRESLSDRSGRNGSDPEILVLSHPAESDRIKTLLGASGGPSA